MSIYKKLSDVRESFHTLQLKKTGFNKFAGYYYFELGDFLIPALQVLKKFGLVSVISFGKEVASMKIINIDKPDEFIEITSPMSSAALKGAHDIQNLGAVQTYLRRYLWVAALEIVEHDALDATTGVKGSSPVITPKGGIGDDLPEDQKEFLREMAQSCTTLVKQGKATEAYLMIKENQLEQDQEVWLSNQLASDIRSAIKKAKPQ